MAGYVRCSWNMASMGSAENMIARTHPTGRIVSLRKSLLALGGTFSHKCFQWQYFLEYPSKILRNMLPLFQWIHKNLLPNESQYCLNRWRGEIFVLIMDDFWAADSSGASKMILWIEGHSSRFPSQVGFHQKVAQLSFLGSHKWPKKPKRAVALS